MINGKIYKIITPKSDKIYIGSTRQQYLSRRLNQHHYQYRTWLKSKVNFVAVFNLFEEFGINNCIIELIEKFKCNTPQELFEREQYWINKNKKLCINIQKAYETEEERKERWRVTARKSYHKNRSSETVILKKAAGWAKGKRYCEKCGKWLSRGGFPEHLKSKVHND